MNDGQPKTLIELQGGKAKVHPRKPDNFDIFEASSKSPSYSLAPPIKASATATNSSSFASSSLPGVIVSCSSYSTSNTASATQNTVPCTFTAPPGVTILISDCSSSGCLSKTSDQYIRLTDSSGNQLAYNDDSCSYCSAITYTTPSTGSAQTYTLNQGCYGSKSCTGQFAVSIQSTFTCPYYTAQSTSTATVNTASCRFSACAGTVITISGCASAGCSSNTNDQYIRLLDSANSQIASQDDGCGSYCSSLSGQITGGGCATFTLVEGCYGSSSCSGSFVISGALPSTTPQSGSSVPSSVPLAVPTTSPSKVPTAAPSFAGATRSPTRSTNNPTRSPTNNPTKTPSNAPVATVPNVPTANSFAPVTNVPVASYPTFGTNGFSYRGSTVMTGTVNVYHIYYGDFSSSVGTQSKTLIDFFGSTIGGSSWYNIMTTYYQTSGTTTTYVSNSVVKKASVALATTQQGGSITSAQIVTQITNLINAGTLPNDPNGVYFFIFRGDISVTWSDGSQWAGASSSGQWCGIHDAFGYGGDYIKFSAVGDTNFGSYGAGCQAVRTTTANGNIGADSLVSVYAHELVETVSDWSGAWYDSLSSSATYGYENADMCGWKFGTMLPGSSNANVVIGGRKWLVQQNWLPTVKGCRQQYP